MDEDSAVNRLTSGCFADVALFFVAIVVVPRSHIPADGLQVGAVFIAAIIIRLARFPFEEISLQTGRHAFTAE